MLSIVFTIAGIAIMVVFAMQVYKTAISTERNAPMWTVATILIGLTIQSVFPFFVGFAIGIYYAATGTPAWEMFGILTVIDVVGLVLSIVAMSLVMKYVSRVKDDDAAAGTPPPPPPSFGGNQ